MAARKGFSVDGSLLGGGKEELRASVLKPYVLRLRHDRGDAEAQAILTKAGLHPALASDETSWVSALTAGRVLQALCETMGRDAIAVRGTWMTHGENLGAYVRLLRSAAGPREGYRQLCDNVLETTRLGTYELEEIGPRKLKITYRPVEGDDGGTAPNDLLSLAREAELRALPRLWGFTDAAVDHQASTAKRDPTSIYLVSWAPTKAARWAVPGGAFGGGLLVGLSVLAAHAGTVSAAVGATVGAALGGVAGLLWHRVGSEKRARTFERNRIAALERSLALRGDDGTEPVAPGELDGTVLGGKYKIIRKIGSGGIGVVYSAENVALGSTVAIKVLRGAAARDASEVARLRREARVQGSIHHPNVVQTLDLDQLPDGSIYVVMELLDGRPLSDRLGKDGPLAPGYAVPVFIQVCRALGAAHARGVVHRDLKPGNIFLCDDGTAKVLDFGMSKFQSAESLTQDGYTLGTPEYMAPEQCVGAPVEARTDLYAFGVLMYEALTGELPIQSSNRRDLLDLHQRQVPTPMRERRPDLPIPEELDEAVMECLRKRPSERPDDAAALERLLARVPLGGLPTSYPRRTWRTPGGAERRRNPA